ncbi:ubiquinol-cytochrome c reductase iron-sulfur subunit [Mucilaginibacter sp. FT3.2]|uniref:QcrA and Rieske domain-containing protein n=1 Tax=Mucilaginibacter sp. FT3.2 TaxID=2723090 RepID=UPI0018428F36|nr:Rieske 2Fe-2S domain-containing protein [Mucilaginibacter sp. FT3.2]MBB6235104.1 cytochrome b6-f complex iron-sulfur subunit [Mucilaginibacter sp. FT3.2]
MDRKEFLSVMGMSAASAVVISCLGCAKNSGSGSSPSTTGPTGIDFTLDLTASANSALLKNGGYLSSNGVLVAKTSAGAYIAVQLSCTHQNYPLVYQASASHFYCNNHGSAFTETGTVLNSPARNNLTTYKTTLTRHIIKSLRIN